MPLVEVPKLVIEVIVVELVVPVEVVALAADSVIIVCPAPSTNPLLEGFAYNVMLEILIAPVSDVASVDGGVPVAIV